MGQAALAASLLSSTPFKQQQQRHEQQQQQQQQQQQSCRAARCAGGGDGCCILRYLGRLMMIPIFMMSFCCPLCTFISVACLFSSFCSGSGSSPRFRCCGTTGMATSAAAASTSEAQQNQPE